MNPLTKVKLINELNEREVQLGVAQKVSWHSNTSTAPGSIKEGTKDIHIIDDFSH